MPSFIDRTGKRYGKLIVLRQAAHIGRKVAWLCRCDCGGEAEVAANKLQTGHVSSCGCLRTEQARRARQYGVIHGHAKANTPTYRSWQSMWVRCTWEKHVAYPRYGGRGITVCPRWKSFIAFLEDLGERPDGMTLDRIDNDKGYYKENCRWATRSEQQRNRRGYGDHAA